LKGVSRAALDWRDKPISLPRQRFDEPRRLSRIVERSPNPLDGGIDPVVEVGEGLLLPERVLEFVTSDQPALALDQQRQHFQRLAAELDPHA